MGKSRVGIAIVGGGASGMMAAISAGRIIPGEDIVLIEKNNKLGRKILATGNGRCNYSNRNCTCEDYHGQDLELIREVFKEVSQNDTVSFFEELGVVTREEDQGRLYPYSEQASTIKEILELELESLNISIVLGNAVKKVGYSGINFEILLSNGETLYADNIIIATGGKAGNQYGSSGDGYGFAKGLGHTLNHPLPGLVQMTTENKVFRELKGVRAKGTVTLIRGSETLSSELGEIQFTESGLSGVCVFNLTRFLGADFNDYCVDIDLFPNYSEETLLQKLVFRKKCMAERLVEKFLVGMMHDKLIPAYLNRWGLDKKLQLSAVTFEDLNSLVEILKSWKISINGTKGWSNAQVTIGGVNGYEVNRKTLESKFFPGLYFAGEILDVDGKCGGWNLQWAWSSGYLAGRSAAENKVVVENEKE